MFIIWYLNEINKKFKKNEIYFKNLKSNNLIKNYQLIMMKSSTTINE